MGLSRIDADDFSISTVVVAHELGYDFWLGHAHTIDCGGKILLRRSNILVNIGVVLAVMVRFLLSKK
jgi:hypothetical protein